MKGMEAEREGRTPVTKEVDGWKGQLDATTEDEWKKPVVNCKTWHNNEIW